MTKPIHIHAWLARDYGRQRETRIYTAKPTRICFAQGDLSYWQGGPSLPIVGHHGLRPGQLKRVVIVEEKV